VAFVVEAAVAGAAGGAAEPVERGDPSTLLAWAMQANRG